MIPKTKLFAWKLNPTKGYLRSIEIDIYGYCPFCENQLENIDHLFMKDCVIQDTGNVIVDIVIFLLKVIIVSLTGSIMFGSMKGLRQTIS